MLLHSKCTIVAPTIKNKVKATKLIKKKSIKPNPLELERVSSIFNNTSKFLNTKNSQKSILKSNKYFKKQKFCTSGTTNREKIIESIVKTKPKSKKQREMEEHKNLWNEISKDEIDSKCSSIDMIYVIKKDKIKIKKPPTLGPESQSDIGEISPSVKEQTHVVHIVKQNKDTKKNLKFKDLSQSISESK